MGNLGQKLTPLPPPTASNLICQNAQLLVLFHQSSSWGWSSNQSRAADTEVHRGTWRCITKPRYGSGQNGMLISACPLPWNRTGPRYRFGNPSGWGTIAHRTGSRSLGRSRSTVSCRLVEHKRHHTAQRISEAQQQNRDKCFRKPHTTILLYYVLICFHVRKLFRCQMSGEFRCFPDMCWRSEAPRLLQQ